MTPVIRNPVWGREVFRNRGGAPAERVVALIRVVLASVSLTAVYLDPTSPARYVTLTYGLLIAYAVYSILVLLAVRGRSSALSRAAAVAIHVGDIAAAGLLTLFTEGPSSPFFVLFGFALLAAGFRWGFWETVATGVVSGILFAVEAVLTGTWPGVGALVEGEFELNRFIMRAAYLVLLAGIVGYIAEHEKVAREDAALRSSFDERARVARELHDGVVQSLIGLKMRVELQRARPPEHAAGPDGLQEIESALAREIRDLRAFLFQTTPIDMEHGELVAVLADLTERFGRAGDVSARFVSTLGDRHHHPSPRARLQIARILQEALVNVRKHSRARNVFVSLSTDGNHGRLVVEDDGVGFTVPGRPADETLDREPNGPRIILERVRLLGGSLTVDSRPGQGARLEVSFPLDA